MNNADNLKPHIEAIKQALKAGRFLNEASVSHGIVLRLLQALGWPTYDVQVTKPEFSIEGRRVDFALCHPADKPLVFIEVKQVGKVDSGERQLFEYAFIQGVPLAILTDGQEWHFYLPAEQGLFRERRFYLLDLLERSTDEVAAYLNRYLDYEKAKSGIALRNAKDDLANATKGREIQSSIPRALKDLLEDRDAILIELIADQTESICGFKPTDDQVSDYLGAILKRLFTASSTAIPEAPEPNGRSAWKKASETLPIGMQAASKVPAQSVITVKTTTPPETTQTGFTFAGKFFAARSAKDAFVGLLRQFQAADPSFAERFAARKLGRSRRYIASDRSELYPNSPHLTEPYSEEIAPGWWVSTNCSKDSFAKIIEKACEVAEVRLGQDVHINLG